MEEKWIVRKWTRLKAAAMETSTYSYNIIIIIRMVWIIFQVSKKNIMDIVKKLMIHMDKTSSQSKNTQI